MILQIIVIVVVTAGLVAVSWKPLRRRDSHGFARFFAWETLTLLLAANLPTWFRDPFSLHQVLSWLSLCVSLFLVIHSLWLLKQAGKPRSKGVQDPEANYAFENTSQLVTIGAYRFIRHPMYSSLLWLGIGIFLKHISLQTVLLLLVSAAFLYWTAVLEEKENLVRFGPQYAEYIKKTKRFIPFVF